MFRQLVGLQRRAKAPFQMVIVYRLTEVTHDSVFQGAIPDDLIRVCCNEDRRNGIPRINKLSVELNSSHSGHLDVGDQAAGFGEERRCQEIGCRGERFDGVAQRRYELSHGFAKGLIIIDDRYQCTPWHRGFRQPLGPHISAPKLSRAACNSVMSVKVRNNAMPAPLSDGLCSRLFGSARRTVEFEAW